MRIERQNAILKLIGEREIETQAELSDALSALGFNVTQATVSRDIKEMRLVKKQTPNGKSIYSKGAETGSDSDLENRLTIVFCHSVISIEYAVNNIVIKTLPGMGSAAGAAVDAMDLPEVVGSIAGDDTVMMVVRSEESARKLVYKLRAMTDM